MIRANDDFEVEWEHPEDAERSWLRDATHSPGPEVPLAHSMMAPFRGAAGLRPSLLINGYAYSLAKAPEFPELSDEEYAGRTGSQAWFELCLPRAEALVATVRGRDYASMTAPELASLLPIVAEESAAISLETFRTVGRMSEEFEALSAFCVEHFGERAGLALELTCGAPNETTAAAEALDRLSGRARDLPEVASAIASGRFNNLEAADGGTEFFTELDSVLERYGWRSPSWEALEQPTMAEQPRQALQLIAKYLANPDGGPLWARARSAEAAAAALERSLAELDGDAGARLQELVELGKGYNAARESRAHYQLLSVGVMRPPVLALGRALTASGMLEEVDDVFYLTMEEVQNAVAGEFAGAGEEASKVRANYDHWRTLQAPTFLGAPLPPMPREMASLMVGMFGRSVPQGPDARVVHGIAGSAEVAEGVARVLTSLDEAERLGTGEVLVCVSTAPPWTALFGIASAVVTDAGGVMSHTAIVAREFAIPCVVSTGDGTRRIADGARVRVDGASGTVTILD